MLPTITNGITIWLETGDRMLGQCSASATREASELHLRLPAYIQLENLTLARVLVFAETPLSKSSDVHYLEYKATVAPNSTELKHRNRQVTRL